MVNKKVGGGQICPLSPQNDFTYICPPPTLIGKLGRSVFCYCLSLSLSFLNGVAVGQSRKRRSIWDPSENRIVLVKSPTLNACGTITAAGRAILLQWDRVSCSPKDGVSNRLIRLSASTIPRSLARRYHDSAWAGSAIPPRAPTWPRITGSNVAPNSKAAGPLPASAARS